MPELPEVETLMRYIRPRVVGQQIREVRILRRRSLWGASPKRFAGALEEQRIVAVSRRAKYLRFDLQDGECFLIHLGMTGRVTITDRVRSAKHDVAYIGCGRKTLVFHDPRKFGHLELGKESLEGLGPEPLANGFTTNYLADALRHSRAPIKVRLLDQALVVGMGNIYACEALWRARIDPQCKSNVLTRRGVALLRRSIVETLRAAIRFGGGLSLNFDSAEPGDGLFYYGSGARRDNPSEHFAVYDREGKSCGRCRAPIARIRLSGRSTFYCPGCQVEF